MPEEPNPYATPQSVEEPAASRTLRHLCGPALVVAVLTATAWVAMVKPGRILRLDQTWGLYCCIIGPASLAFLLSCYEANNLRKFRWAAFVAVSCGVSAFFTPILVMRIWHSVDLTMPEPARADLLALSGIGVGAVMLNLFGAGITLLLRPKPRRRRLD